MSFPTKCTIWYSFFRPKIQVKEKWSFNSFLVILIIWNNLLFLSFHKQNIMMMFPVLLSFSQFSFVSKLVIDSSTIVGNNHYMLNNENAKVHSFVTCLIVSRVQNLCTCNTISQISFSSFSYYQMASRTEHQSKQSNFIWDLSTNLTTPCNTI